MRVIVLALLVVSRARRVRIVCTALALVMTSTPESAAGARQLIAGLKSRAT